MTEVEEKTVVADEQMFDEDAGEEREADGGAGEGRTMQERAPGHHCKTSSVSVVRKN